MEPRKVRKRITYVQKGIPAIEDNLAFVQNKCSVKARQTFIHSETIRLNGWIDKHYHDRYQHGDDMGKRDGIDPEIVERLVKKSIKHLLVYSATVKGFRFLNHEQFAEQGHRVIIREEYGESMLYVVVQAHLLGIAEFELTVITAVKGDLKIAAGQYVVEIQENSSNLYKFDNGRFSEIGSF